MVSLENESITENVKLWSVRQIGILRTIQQMGFSEAFLPNLFAKCFLSISGLFLLHHLL